MPFIEYMLLAMVGAAPATAVRVTPSVTTSARTITAATMPGGSGAGDPSAGIGQNTNGDKGRKSPGTGKKGRSHRDTKGHLSTVKQGGIIIPPSKVESRRGRRKVTGSGSTVSSSSGGTGGIKPNMNAQPRPPRPRRAGNSNKNSK